MKKWLFLMLLMAVVTRADTLKIDYGYGVAARTGYELDSAMLLDYHGYSVDTLLDTIYIDVTGVDTFVVITGTGYHRVVLQAIFDGYPNEWYEAKTWELMLSTKNISSGQYACTLLTVDTSTTPDSARANISIDLNTASGDDWQNLTIGAGQTSVIVYLDSGTYYTSASSIRQVWASKTLSVTGNSTDTIFGYSTFSFAAVTAPADTNLCIVYGMVRGIDQTPARNATVTITPPPIYSNTCDSSFFVMPKISVTKTGPWNNYDVGYFADTLLKCSCMEDTTLVYKIRIEEKVGNTNVVLQEFEFNIPADSGSYLLTPFSDD